jgi:hypothetical protein
MGIFVAMGVDTSGGEKGYIWTTISMIHFQPTTTPNDQSRHDIPSTQAHLGEVAPI